MAASPPRRKPAGIDMEGNSVTVTLCIGKVSVGRSKFLECTAVIAPPLWNQSSTPRNNSVTPIVCPPLFNRLFCLATHSAAVVIERRLQGAQPHLLRLGTPDAQKTKHCNVLQTNTGDFWNPKMHQNQAHRGGGSATDSAWGVYSAECSPRPLSWWEDGSLPPSPIPHPRSQPFGHCFRESHSPSLLMHCTLTTAHSVMTDTLVTLDGWVFIQWGATGQTRANCAVPNKSRQQGATRVAYLLSHRSCCIMFNCVM